MRMAHRDSNIDSIHNKVYDMHTISAAGLKWQYTKATFVKNAEGNCDSFQIRNVLHVYVNVIAYVTKHQNAGRKIGCAANFCIGYCIKQNCEQVGTITNGTEIIGSQTRVNGCLKKPANAQKYMVVSVRWYWTTLRCLSSVRCLAYRCLLVRGKLKITRRRSTAKTVLKAMSPATYG